MVLKSRVEPVFMLLMTNISGPSIVQNVWPTLVDRERAIPRGA